MTVVQKQIAIRFASYPTIMCVYMCVGGGGGTGAYFFELFSIYEPAPVWELHYVWFCCMRVLFSSYHLRKRWRLFKTIPGESQLPCGHWWLPPSEKQRQLRSRVSFRYLNCEIHSLPLKCVCFYSHQHWNCFWVPNTWMSVHIIHIVSSGGRSTGDKKSMGYKQMQNLVLCCQNYGGCGQSRAVEWGTAVTVSYQKCLTYRVWTIYKTLSDHQNEQ